MMVWHLFLDAHTDSRMLGAPAKATHTEASETLCTPSLCVRTGIGILYQTFIPKKLYSQLHIRTLKE